MDLDDEVFGSMPMKWAICLRCGITIDYLACNDKPRACEPCLLNALLAFDWSK